MAGRPRPRTRRRAFTLLELVIAMSITAMIALTLYTALATAFRARASTIAQTGMVREAAIALDLIEADLANATPPKGTQLFGPFVGGGGSDGAVSSGTISFHCLGRDLTTTTTTATAAGQQPDDPLAEGVRLVEFSLAADAATGKLALVRRVQRNLLPSGAAALEEESLLGDVAALTFRFYDGAQWLEAWNSDDVENALPIAVEVGIDLKTSDGRGGERAYHMTRLVPIPCAAPATTTEGT